MTKSNHFQNKNQQQNHNYRKNYIRFVLKKLRYKNFVIFINLLKPFFQKYLLKLNLLYSEIKRLYYSGKTLYCPCCEYHFRKFLPHGKYLRSIALCPNCGSLERHRLLLLYLYFNTDFFSEKLRVLHFSPSYALEKRFRKLLNIEYITSDIENPRVTIKMDITNIKYNHNSFDVILCNHILEHVQDDARAMKELFRVLKPNGWAIIQVPIDFNLKTTFEDRHIVSPKEREYYYGHRNHVRQYGLDYFEKLKKVGFKVKIDEFINELDKNNRKRYGLRENSKIFYCFK